MRRESKISRFETVVQRVKETPSKFVSDLTNYAVLVVAVLASFASAFGVSVGDEVLTVVAVSFVAVAAQLLFRLRRAVLDTQHVANELTTSRSRYFCEIDSEEVHWDIRSRSDATMTLTRKMTMVRDDVSVLEHWFDTDASQIAHDRDLKAVWTKAEHVNEPASWNEARCCDKFKEGSGRKFIFSLKDVLNDGDQIVWKLERPLIGSFLEPKESAGVKAPTSSNIERTMRITWPHDEEIIEGFITQGDSRIEIDVDRKGVRAQAERKVPYGRMGSGTHFEWRWARKP